MMRRESLENLRSVSHKMDFHANAQLVQQLADSHLEALDIITRLHHEKADLIKESSP